MHRHDVATARGDGLVRPTLLVLVPYRAGLRQEARRGQLEAFLERMPPFLEETCGLDACIVVVEQTDDERKFNRGALLNAGFVWAERRAPGHVGRAVCFHDVDLLPTASRAMATAYQSVVPRGAVHLARAWKRYDTDTYLGGALTLDPALFREVNGFPNGFWGWGGEDDELRDRLEQAAAVIVRNEDGEYVDLERMDLRAKLGALRGLDLKCMDKWEVRDEYAAARRAGRVVEGLRESIGTVEAVGRIGEAFHLRVALDGGKTRRAPAERYR